MPGDPSFQWQHCRGCLNSCPYIPNVAGHAWTDHSTSKLTNPFLGIHYFDMYYLGKQMCHSSCSLDTDATASQIPRAKQPKQYSSTNRMAKNAQLLRSSGSTVTWERSGGVTWERLGMCVTGEFLCSLLAPLRGGPLTNGGGNEL